MNPAGAGADPVHGALLAQRLERAYRLALWLHETTLATGTGGCGDDETSAAWVAAAELVDVLDEARASLVAAQSGRPAAAFRDR